MKQPVLFLTGGSRGLGRAMALHFASKGYAVSFTYVQSSAAADQTRQEIEAFGHPALALKADVRSSRETESAVQRTAETWGRIDVLINNAGITRDRRLEKMTDDDWKDVVDVNLNGPFYATRAVLPLMRDAKKGAIINVVSYLAKKPVIGTANYAASKAGLLSLTQSTALEASSFGVRVNAVMPGFHVTDMNRSVWERFGEKIRQEHLLEELPTPEGLAEFVYHVAHLKTVTGQIFAYESRL